MQASWLLAVGPKTIGEEDWTAFAGGGRRCCDEKAAMDCNHAAAAGAAGAAAARAGSLNADSG